MKRNKKRIFSGVTAVCCAAAVLVAGTFAWRAVSSAVNEFSDRLKTDTKDPGGNLHDDFDSNTGEKKIYVENTGNTDIYVRVMLQEILGLDSDEKPAGAAWETHMPANGAVEDCEAGDDYHSALGDAFAWTLGNDSPYGFHSIMNSTEWNAGQVSDDIEGSRKNTDKLVGDALGSATGGSTIVNLDGTTPGKTAPAAQVITMAEYQGMTAAAKAGFAGWIYDVDGYAYWSQPLAAGAATGLLLNGVAIPGAETETYYYAINAIMEYVDTDDLGAWTNAGSDGKREITLNGKGQMESHANEKGAVIKEGTQAGQTTIEASVSAKDMLLEIADAALRAEGATTLLTKGEQAAPPTVKDVDGNEVSVTWSSSDDSIVSVDPVTGEITGVEVGGPVTITGTADNGSEVTYVVNVVEEEKDPLDLTAVNPPADLNVGDKEDAPEVKDGEGNVVDIVDWESSNPEVATVDPDTGEITAVAPGETTITGTDEDGNEVEFVVTVTDVLTANPSAVSVEEGDSVAIPTIKDVNGNVVNPADLTWTSADSSKVTVNGATGEITGVLESTNAVKVTGTDANGNKVEIMVTVGKGAEQKLIEALDPDVVIDGYYALENIYEGCSIGNDYTWPIPNLIPYYAVEPLNGRQDFGTIEDNYGEIEISKFLTDSEYAANVTFTSTDDKVVKVENGILYVWYLPNYDEFRAAGYNDGFRPGATITATYTDPVSGDSASQDLTVYLMYMGTIDMWD